MKEKALGTSERLGTKVQQRENRKVSLTGCCRKVPCATSVTDLYSCSPLPVSTRTSQTSMGLKLRPPLFLSLVHLRSPVSPSHHYSAEDDSCLRLPTRRTYLSRPALARVLGFAPAITRGCEQPPAFSLLHNTKSRIPQSVVPESPVLPHWTPVHAG
jgi:hypothetical protein